MVECLKIKKLRQLCIVILLLFCKIIIIIIIKHNVIYSAIVLLQKYTIHLFNCYNLSNVI